MSVRLLSLRLGRVSDKVVSLLMMVSLFSGSSLPWDGARLNLGWRYSKSSRWLAESGLHFFIFTMKYRLPSGE